MLSNTLREKLRSNAPVSGCTISGFVPDQVEILGLLGYDFAFLDSEHWPLNDRELSIMIMAGDAAGIACLVRVRENSPAAIQRVMDSGAAGIIVPDCSTPKLVKQAADALKYAPIGNRGLSTTRASSYGLRMGLADYVKYANDHSVLVCQIESREGLENAERIVANDLIDTVFIGTTDLSHDLGHTGQRNHPEVDAAVERIVSCARQAGKAYGAMVRAGENPHDYIKQGYAMTVATGSSFFTGGAQHYIRQFAGK
ncbi:MAG TPA: aldolase/citrate lyase family protein [Anaerovoracaceae bacterium]|nr:aldolase/citrate lyase family protein [Anaerovoracaceae bacterium]